MCTSVTPQANMVLEFDVPLEVAQTAREQAKELSFSDAAKVRCLLPATVGQHSRNRQLA